MCSTSRRAQALHDLEARHRLPVVEHLGREHLGGGHGKAQAGEVGRLRLGRLGQRGVERRQAEEHGRPVAGNAVEDGGGARLARQQHARCADREREGDRVAHAVGEEDLRHREAHVALAQPQQVARVGEVRVGHVVLQVHDPLRPARRARRVHPERHVVAVRVGGVPAPAAARRATVRPAVVATGPAAAASPLMTTRVSSRVPSQAVALNRVGESSVRNSNRRPRIRQIELQQVGRRQRIDQQRHEARADGAEQRRRIGRRVVEEQQHAVAALQAERQQAGAECGGIGGKLGVGARPRRPGDGGTPAVGREVVEEDGAGVVALGDGEADLPGARGIAGNRILQRGLPSRSSPPHHPARAS